MRRMTVHFLAKRSGSGWTECAAQAMRRGVIRSDRVLAAFGELCHPASTARSCAARGNYRNAPKGNSCRMASLSRRSFLRAAVGACALTAHTLLAGCAGSNQQETDASSESSSTDETSTVQKVSELTTTLFAFDTVVTIRALCDQATLDALAERCQYFESKFSRTIATSDIGRINAAAGSPVDVAPETADLVAKALRYCAESDGRFDITIGAVSSLWDFKEGVLPASHDIAEAVTHVDYTQVQVDGVTITLLDPKAKLDLGGIAKGYIADELCRMLKQAGCESGCVNLGGNVKTLGVKPDGTPWHVGIQDPNNEQGSVIAAVYSEGTSVVTSGLYERQFELDGKRYWHILDPRTGYPVETDLVSATLISTASIDGDGYTKPLFMMGHDEALDWIESKEGIEGLVVDADGVITQSSGCGAEVAQ